MLDDGFIRVDSCGSEFGVEIPRKISGVDVATSDVECHSVTAQRRLLIGHVVLVSRLLVNVLLGLRVLVVDSASTEVISIRQLLVAACEDPGAGGDHLVCESELLAVKLKGCHVLTKFVLSIATCILQVRGLLGSLIEGTHVLCLVIVDVVLVICGSIRVSRDS